MADSWEDEADDLAAGKKLPIVTDKWDDEDLDDVPDAWDAEEEAPAAEGEEKKTESAAGAAKPKKRGKKALIEAAEKKRLEEEEKRRLAAESAASAAASGEAVQGMEQLSKEEQRRLQEEADLLVAKDTFGVDDNAIATVDPQKSIDLINPVSKEDFDKLNKLLAQKLRKYEASPHYPIFVESLFRDCTLELDCESLRKLSTMFSALATEKQKLQKVIGGKGKGKGKGKGVVKVERDPAALNEDMGYDEYDDFI